MLFRSIRARRAAAGEAAEETDVSLTPDQRTALDDIRADLAGRRPMMRLLQGDVGSGKTAVAALALAFTADALEGVALEDGQLLWRIPLVTQAKRHAASPSP